MQLVCALSLLVALVPGPQATAAKPAAKAATPSAKGVRTVELTSGDDMKYSQTQIAAKPGETLHVVLKNVGTVPKIAMAHNFVLLTLTADPAAFITASVNARETDYVPQDKKADILASTKLAGPGETVEATFKVPAKAGSYTYLCTFPGHYATGMKGQLVVQ